jgi:peptidoglycan/xylan/chitin deacetylase (PgdA/CDA1 family)
MKKALMALLVLTTLMVGFLSPLVPTAKAQNNVGVYERGNKGKMLVALTFDVCPGDGNYLDLNIVGQLKVANVPATFFVSGEFAQTNQESIRQLAADGFDVQAHSWDHKVPMTELDLQIQKTNDLLESITGVRPWAMRLPAGYWLNYSERGIWNGVVDEERLRAINAYGVSVVDWDVVGGDPGMYLGDPNSPSAQQIFDAVKRQVTDGSIVVLHANGRGTNTAEAVGMLIPWLREQGYTLVSVSEMRDQVGLEPVLETTSPTVVPENSAGILAKKQYHISAHVGGSFPNYGYPNYAQNMRMFFAYVSAGRDMTKVALMDLNNFSGKYDFVHDPTWLNGVFGPYCTDQGMVDAEVGKTKMGGGACNTTSMVADILVMAGAEAEGGAHYWATIPEVHPDYQLQVGTSCGSMDPKIKSGNDVEIIGAKGLTLYWSVVDDVITLWVTRTEDGDQFPPSFMSSDRDLTPLSNSELAAPFGWIDQLEDNDNPVVWVVVVVVLILVVLVTIRTWWTDRQMTELKNQSGVEIVYKKSKLLVVYWWLTVLMIVAAFWSRDEVIWTFTGVAGQIWAGLKVRDWVSRFFRHMNIHKIGLPWWADLGKEFVLVVWAGVYLSYTVAFAVVYVPALLANEPLQASWSVSYESLSGTGRQPVKVQIPTAPKKGEVLAPVWDKIWAGVQAEGGTTSEAMLLYAVQRSECARVDFKSCTSSAGAQGPFQFMPGTWPSYADPSWSVWDLEQSARAAHRMFTRLRLFEQTDKLSFQNRFTGQDGGLVWNRGTPGSAANDGWDQSGEVWDQYMATLTLANSVGMPVVASDPATALVDAPVCSDPMEPCGFALPGGPSSYVQGTTANGGKGWHENAWDWWYPGEEVSPHGITPPTNVLSMLNGRVSEIGRFSNGGLGGGTTYLKVTNGRWTQVVYHCDDIVGQQSNYVKVGDTVSWGSPLCVMGNQGQSAWTHLHLSLDGPNGPVMDQTQWWP